MILLAQVDRFTLFLLVAIGLSIAILMLRAHRYLRRQRGDDRALVVPLPPTSGPPTRLMDGPSELARWEVEMHETARDLSAELSSRIAVLQAMVAEADRAAARLEAALDKTAALGRGATSARDGIPTRERPPLGPKPTREAVYELADYGFPCRDIAARLGHPPDDIERILRSRK